MIQKCSYSKSKDTACYQGTKYILVKLLQLSISLLQALAAHTLRTPKRKEHVDPLCATYLQITVKSHVLFNFFFSWGMWPSLCWVHWRCWMLCCWLLLWYLARLVQPHMTRPAAGATVQTGAGGLWLGKCLVYCWKIWTEESFRWNMIARVCVVLNRTVVESTWRFANRCSSYRQGDTTHFDTEDN